MSLSISDLTKSAINSALSKNWEEAIRINLSILEEKIPELLEVNGEQSKYVLSLQVETNLRLGFAYLQTRDYKKAKKCYKEVLNIDPINKIAIEKMKSVNEEKTEEFIVPDTEVLLKEPGTSIEVSLEILTKGITAEKFKFGEELLFRVNNKIISIHKDTQNQPLINYLTETVAKYFNKALREKAEIKIKFIGGKDKKIKIIITSSISVFPSEKQDVRPYVKSEDSDIVEDVTDEGEVERPIKTTSEDDSHGQQSSDEEVENN
jgi:tetratricopeptide (TPR) repeat protein